MDKLGKHLSLISFFVIGIILLVGFLKGQPFQEMLTIGVRFSNLYSISITYFTFSKRSQSMTSVSGRKMKTRLWTLDTDYLLDHPLILSTFQSGGSGHPWRFAYCSDCDPCVRGDTNEQEEGYRQKTALCRNFGLCQRALCWQNRDTHQEWNDRLIICSDFFLWHRPSVWSLFHRIEMIYYLMIWFEIGWSKSLSLFQWLK